VDKRAKSQYRESISEYMCEFIRETRVYTEYNICVTRIIKIKILKYSLCIYTRRIKENKRKRGQTQEKTRRSRNAYIKRTRAVYKVYQGKSSDIYKCAQSNKRMNKTTKVTDRRV
ncbi:hypothetical protein NERG_02667, partial [Nematocida ausubeli]